MLGDRDEDGGRAEAVLASAAALRLNLHAITEQLQADPITSFASSTDELLATVAQKRRQMEMAEQ